MYRAPLIPRRVKIRLCGESLTQNESKSLPRATRQKFSSSWADSSTCLLATTQNLLIQTLSNTSANRHHILGSSASIRPIEITNVLPLYTIYNMLRIIDCHEFLKLKKTFQHFWILFPIRWSIECLTSSSHGLWVNELLHYTAGIGIINVSPIVAASFEKQISIRHMQN